MIDFTFNGVVLIGGSTLLILELICWALVFLFILFKRKKKLRKNKTLD